MRLALLASALASAMAAGLTFHAPDVLELKTGNVRALFNLTRGSLDVVQGRFLGDGIFSASPNLAGAQATPEGTPRGALAVLVQPAGTSTSSFSRASPLPYTSNVTATTAAFTVTLTDASSSPSVSMTLTLGVDDAAPRQISAALTSVTALKAFSPTLVALSTTWAPPDVVAWYDMAALTNTSGALGVRQGFDMGRSAYLSSAAAPITRWYGIGDGLTGAIEVRPTSSPVLQSYIFAGTEGSTRAGLGLALFGSASPADGWTGPFTTGPTTNVEQDQTAPPVSMALFPNDWSFPPSRAVPDTIPARANLTDLRSILTAVHGSPVSALHSYDEAPEVRAAPCLVYQGNQCYSPTTNYFDPDSCISTSSMLYSFDVDVQSQVRGQLETNMRHVCPEGTDPATCEPGQCIHHFVDNCAFGATLSEGCICVQVGAVTDCFVYNALSGAVQTGPNVFTMLSALRYAGTTGDGAWLLTNMPKLRLMMSFLEARFNPTIGLYLAPGSLQIDVFQRNNYTSDTNAAMVILVELFADAETYAGNATGAAALLARANILRGAINKYLLAASGDHYVTQSDPLPGGGAAICSDSAAYTCRDFVDYDANALAVAARVPSPAVAAAILKRVDSGECAHAGRATYVSEIYYNASNCVKGNTGDSAVSMGRIAWQDSLARRSVGGPAAAALFEGTLLYPLQRDLLARTWLPERFTCSGQDAHSAFYFEYPSTVALMLYEVRYGLSLEMTRVVVDPLSARDWDFVAGQNGLHIGYHGGTAFHAALPTGHTGGRTFIVTGMVPGSYTVLSTDAGNNVTVPVASDGILRFDVAQVGPGQVVDATLLA